MAAYEYTCTDTNCPGYLYVFTKMQEKRPAWKKCPVCEGRCLREFAPPQLSIFVPYVTPDITGSEIEITCPSQEERLCKEHGVTRLLSTDMTGSREEIKKNRKKRFDNAVAGLGSFEEQYQKNTQLIVNSGE